MKKILLTILAGLISMNTYSQSEITAKIKADYNNKKYAELISKHAETVSDYPAKAIYYIGMAYYMAADDNNVLKMMNLSIQKDATDPDAYYIKGATFNYMGQFDKAIEPFNTAIALDSSNANYYSGLGDSYYNLKKYDLALSAYVTSTKQIKPIDRAFTMIPQIYVNLKQPKKALQAFYNSKANISIVSESYITALYNIGLYEYLNKAFNKSEVAFKELIELSPNDFHSYAKLIQAYYGKKEYEKAKPYRNKLYKAYDQGKLTGPLKNKFCFDQFEHNDKLILAYERFAVVKGELYYKHIFFITNDKGETEFTIQTENSTIAEEMGAGKYAVGMDKNGTHSTFGFIKEDFNYDDLKSTVIKILDEDIKAGASSNGGKK